METPAAITAKLEFVALGLVVPFKLAVVAENSGEEVTFEGL